MACQPEMEPMVRERVSASKTHASAPAAVALVTVAASAAAAASVDVPMLGAAARSCRSWDPSWQAFWASTDPVWPTALFCSQIESAIACN